ncbi:MAG TPA: acriflavine resistance protein B, partial [Solibacterales bacterium]|nr:acriflavine resistance protein B [Bryobacterales bacterium]
QSRLYRKSEEIYEWIIRQYATTLRWVLANQGLTLLVAVATLAATVVLFLIVPKGFFPVQDTGGILGITEASPAISFSAMAERQKALAHAILQDPAVESLTSFIGVDGTNTTINSGRIQINLKPLEERGLNASDVIRRIQPTAAKVDGIALFMQPLQDLTVEDRISRTQYQYSLEDPDQAELFAWAPRFLAKLQSLPQLRDAASDQQEGGLQAALTIDRDTASRFGITPQLIDDTLYDAFGQRQVSTIFTQLNQYHVVLEAKPQYQQNVSSLNDIYVRANNGMQIPLNTFTH